MHFAVMVVTKDGDIDTALEPFDEQLRVEPYVDRTKDEAMKDACDEVKRYVKYLKEAYDSQKKYYIAPWPVVEDERNEYVHRIPTREDVENSRKLLELDDDEKYKWYIAEYADEGVDADGNILTTYNPNSQWDWYVIGGRWANMLRLKEGGRTNSAKVSDIDFDPDVNAYAHSKRFWEVYVDGKPLEEGELEENFKAFSSPEWFRNTYHDAETYATVQAEFTTFAVLDIDGNWHEKGWSAEGNDEWVKTYHDKFIANLSSDDVVTIVDCHI